jgi:hypothetical protein
VASIKRKRIQNDLEKAAILYETLGRLPNQELLNMLLEAHGHENLNAFGLDCLEKIEAFSKALEGEAAEAIHHSVNTESTRELNLIRGKIVDY